MDAGTHPSVSTKRHETPDHGPSQTKDLAQRTEGERPEDVAEAVDGHQQDEIFGLHREGGNLGGGEGTICDGEEDVEAFWSIDSHVRLSFEIWLDILPLDQILGILQLERDNFGLCS